MIYAYRSCCKTASYAVPLIFSYLLFPWPFLAFLRLVPSLAHDDFWADLCVWAHGDHLIWSKLLFHIVKLRLDRRTWRHTFPTIIWASIRALRFLARRVILNYTSAFSNGEPNSGLFGVSGKPCLGSSIARVVCLSLACKSVQVWHFSSYSRRNPSRSTSIFKTSCPWWEEALVSYRPKVSFGPDCGLGSWQPWSEMVPSLSHCSCELCGFRIGERSHPWSFSPPRVFVTMQFML